MFRGSSAPADVGDDGGGSNTEPACVRTCVRAGGVAGTAPRHKPPLVAGIALQIVAAAVLCSSARK